jgi:A nuclease family of the HNH/ENDO VII superfamily with conserved AHH
MRNLKDYLCKSGSELGGKSSAAVPMLGAGLSLYSASSALPDLMMLDKATQAQRGGAGKLTPQSEGEAKFNLYMGYTNLVLAGVDAGAHKLAFNVAKAAGNKGLQALSNLDRAALAKLLLNARALRAGTSPEMVQVMDSLRQATGNDKKLYQQLLDAFKKARDKFPPSGGGSPQLATEGVGGNTGRVTEELGKKNQPLQSAGKGAATRTKPIKIADNLSDEAAEKLLAKYPQWDNVKEFVSKRLDPNNLPPGYKYRVKNGKPELYRDSTEGPFPPLTVNQDGVVMLQTGKSTRLSVFSRYKKNYLEWVEQTQGKAARTAAEQRLVDGNQLHHLTPDAVVQRNQLTQELMKRSKKYTLDRGTNILDMPTLHDPKTGEIVHLGSHQRFNKYVDGLLNEQIRDLTRGKTIPLSDVKVNDLDKAVRQVEDTLREQIKNRTLPRDILEPLENGGFKISEGNQKHQGDEIA